MGKEGAASRSDYRYDLLLRNGRILDPERGSLFTGDIATADGHIAALGTTIDPSSAVRTIDVGGKLITPGLIDLHAHGYWGVTYDGLRVDAVAARSGVTTWVDPGSAGAATFPGFRRYVIEQSRTRMVPFLNLCAVGIIYRGVLEFQDLRFADVAFAVETIEANRDLIAGVKVRLGRGIVGDNKDRPLWLAREVADQTGLPIMVHIGPPPPSLSQILAALKPGDIVTHCFRGDGSGVDSILLADRIRPEVREARERGVRFDVGHGTSSLSFLVARAALAEGFVPDTISSDLHQKSILGPAYDLPTVMAKFLALGLSLEEVVRRTTLVPAQVLGREDGLGTLRVGAPADLAVFAVEQGEFPFADAMGNTLAGRVRLSNVLTVRAGEPLPREQDYGPLPLFLRPR